MWSSPVNNCQLRIYYTLTHRSSQTFYDVVSLFKSRLQVSILDGSNWLIEGLGGNGLLSITPAVNIF